MNLKIYQTYQTKENVYVIVQNAHTAQQNNITF